MSNSKRLNLKLKLFSVLTNFQICRTKHDVDDLSTFRPEVLPRSRSAVNYYRPSSFNSKAVDIPFPSPPPSTPVSVGCGCRGWPHRDRGDMIKKTVRARASEEADFLVISDHSFFSDDDDELPSLESRKKRIKKMRKMRRGGGRWKEKEEAAVMGGVAVVKISDDPYEDFKRSMVEMIVEKDLLEAEELEELLHCFLSLNSRNYHAVIVEAFTHIWDQLFSASSPHHI